MNTTKAKAEAAYRTCVAADKAEADYRRRVANDARTARARTARGRALALAPADADAVAAVANAYNDLARAYPQLSQLSLIHADTRSI